MSTDTIPFFDEDDLREVVYNATYDVPRGARLNEWLDNDLRFVQVSRGEDDIAVGIVTTADVLTAFDAVDEDPTLVITVFDTLCLEDDGEDIVWTGRPSLRIRGTHTGDVWSGVITGTMQPLPF